MYKDLSEQREEAFKDLPILQDELEISQKEASLVKSEHAVLVEKVRLFEINNERLIVVDNATTSQVQEKIDLIDQLRAEMNKLKASTETLRSRMDLLASEKEATKEELASIRYQLRVMKDKADKCSRLNDELRAQLSSPISKRDDLDREYTALKSKLEAASTDSSEVEEMLAQYKNNEEIGLTKRKEWRCSARCCCYINGQSREANLFVLNKNEQADVITVNAKTKNLLYNAVTGEEYENISSCETAKEMWDKLEVTYEGTNKVKETRINLLVRDYKLFQMKNGESVEEMFSRFRKILGDLKSFGRPIKSGEQVRKILRSLPTIWQPKVIVLECQDLDKISYDELRGDLIAFEKTHLDRKIQEKKKTVAFKATVVESENEEEEGREQDENIAMLSQVVTNMMRRNRKNRRGKFNFRKGRMNNEADKNDGRCYECGKLATFKLTVRN
ncbi:uncharacterized protein [Nicotiana tomentosiformis]|uniref:uncharacterized protein n=1 Tax=Nicotiana tomentosiformis TaxID=4098 RepID=UPI00388CA78A